jgi:hypothetical protein
VLREKTRQPSGLGTDSGNFIRRGARTRLCKRLRWAQPELAQAEELKLLPAELLAADQSEPISRLAFAKLAVSCGKPLQSRMRRSPRKKPSPTPVISP